MRRRSRVEGAGEHLDRHGRGPGLWPFGRRVADRVRVGGQGPRFTGLAPAGRSRMRVMPMDAGLDWRRRSSPPSAHTSSSRPPSLGGVKGRSEPTRSLRRRSRRRCRPLGRGHHRGGSGAGRQFVPGATGRQDAPPADDEIATWPFLRHLFCGRRLAVGPSGRARPAGGSLREARCGRSRRVLLGEGPHKQDRRGRCGCGQAHAWALWIFYGAVPRRTWTSLLVGVVDEFGPCLEVPATTEPARYNRTSLDEGRWPPQAASGPTCLLRPPGGIGLSLVRPSTSSAGRS